MKNKTLILLYSLFTFPFLLFGLINTGNRIDLALHDTYIVIDFSHILFFLGSFGLIHLITYWLLRKRETLKLLDRFILVIHAISLLVIVAAVVGILSLTLEPYRNSFSDYEVLLTSGIIGLIGNLFLQLANALFTKKKIN